MKRWHLILTILFLILLPSAGIYAKDEYEITFVIRPFADAGSDHPAQIMEKAILSDGDQIVIAPDLLGITVTVEKAGENQLAFSFDQTLLLTSGAVTAETNRITVESFNTATLRTKPEKDGAYLDIIWINKEIDPKYQDLIHEMSIILSGKKSERFSESDYSVMFMVQSAWTKDQTLGYIITDLDGDGQEELFFGDMNPDENGTRFYDMYTVSHGKLIHIFTGTDRNRFYLSSDSSIIQQGSSSVSHFFTALFVYSDNELHLLRSVIHDGDKNRSAPWFISYLDPYDSNTAQQVFEEQAREILARYSYQTLELKPFRKLP